MPPSNAPRFRATVPRLPVADVTATLRFYVGKLGFQPLYRFGDEAGVGLGDIIIRFCEGQPVASEDLTVYVEITRTDQLFEQYQTEGVDVIFPPRDQPWGSRDFGIRDIDGYRLIFGDFRDDSGRPKPSPQLAVAIETMMAGDLSGLADLLDRDPSLIHQRAPLTHRDDRQGTLLHFLIDYPLARHPDNVVEIARLLIDGGAEAQSLGGDNVGSTPLQLLMALDQPSADQLELTRLLLEAGATFDVGNDDQHGMDAFTVALLNGHTESAALMWQRGYRPDFPWAGAGLGNMLLVHSFFGEGNDQTLPAADRAEALGEEAQGRMNCAFLVAAINGQTEVVDYLLSKGMDVDMQPPGSDFAGIGATALHWAARNGHAETVKTLLARGATASAQDDVFQLTPADWAGWYGHHEARQLLLAAE